MAFQAKYTPIPPWSMLSDRFFDKRACLHGSEMAQLVALYVNS